MILKIISVVLTVFLICSCAPKQAMKKDIKETPPVQPSEEIKLPELPQKPKETKEVKKAESLRVEKEAEEKYVILNFDGADIETVISTIGELLNMNYLLAPGVTGKVTIQSYRKFPVKDLFQIFQTILEVNGLTAVKDGTLYRIVPIDTAKQQPVSVQSGKELKLQLDSSFITQIIPLEYVKANDIVNVLRNLMPRGADLIVYEPTNLLIVTAPPAALVKFMKILEALDIPATERESIRTFVYYVEHGDAKKLVEIFKTLYGEKKEKKATTPRPTTTTPSPTQPKTATTPTPVSVEGLIGEIEGEIVITAYEDINGIIVKASPRSYLAILEALKKLDVPVKQVLIEVLIAEVSLTDTTKFGLEWLLKAPVHINGDKLVSYSGFDSSSSDFAGTIDTGSISTITSPTGSFFASIIKAERYGAILTAFAGIGKVNVLASPHILAMDNKEAKIEIGEEIPVATGFQQSPSTSSTGETTTTSYVASGQIQYRTTGVLLTVTPHISEKNQVTLKISQEISNRGADVSLAGITSPSFTTRKAQTTGVVQGGHTLIIGGLISEQKSNTEEGLPLLSNIPVLGYLFGTTKDEIKKTELVVMVTPHVISSIKEADTLTRDFQDKIKTIKERIEKIKPLESSSLKNVVTVIVEKDSTLMDVIESNGYILKDEDLNAFLSEFIELNEDVKSINMIPKGSAIKLPLNHLKKEQKKS